MGLPDLPAELMQLVIEQTLPEGFESFALSCKFVYELSRKHIPRHNMLKRKYKHVSVDAGLLVYRERHSSIGVCVPSALQLLIRIAREPLIARYIENADLMGATMEASDRREDWERFQTHTRKEGLIKQLIEQSQYLHEAKQNLDYWMALILEDVHHQHFAGLLLLTLLPNVRTLTLPGDAWDMFPAPPISSERHSDQDEDGIKSEALWSVLDVIQRRANDKNLQHAGLSRLTTIYPSNQTGYRHYMSLQTLAPFLAISSVEKLFEGSCVAKHNGRSGKAFEMRYENFESHMETVELAGACIDATHLTKFLSPMTRLKSLKISFEGKFRRWGFGDNWDAGAFIAAIECNTRYTLEDLSVSIVRRGGFAGTGVVSMKGFQKLRVLELDTEVLHGPAYSGLGDQSNSMLKNGGPKGTEAIPRLVDLLPTSLVDLKLLICEADSEYDVNILFSGFAKEFRYHLPRLSSVEIAKTITNNPLCSILSHAIQDTGDSLKWLYIESEDHHTASFQKCFDNRFGTDWVGSDWVSHKENCGCGQECLTET